tara:strand:+ start:887 stop:1183 length:297 start_codon:yes stop_codon:yes gene_type:complete
VYLMAIFLNQMFPRFKKANTWKDGECRQWMFAGKLPEWEALDIWDGVGMWCHSKEGIFPEEDDVIVLFREDKSVTVRFDILLDVNNTGFKCLALVYYT